jgi:curved DNA-binding protein
MITRFDNADNGANTVETGRQPPPRDGVDAIGSAMLAPLRAGAPPARVPMHDPYSCLLAPPADDGCDRAARACPGARGGRGDLYARVQIVVPKQLDDRERELYEQLAAASRFDPREARREQQQY